MSALLELHMSMYVCYFYELNKISKAILGQTNGSQEEIPKIIYDEEKALEKNWKVHVWQFTQLNSAIGYFSIFSLMILLSHPRLKHKEKKERWISGGRVMVSDGGDGRVESGGGGVVMAWPSLGRMIFR
ncbi:hypothetical protein F2Q69_00037276 [Brassica cretica]|uniref:Transmembrane protein n=1 Tax=Brassica cretica TaxID=69181 RepID=A0A8S9SIP1_BRACR|nr:hypothetical protein F2Q69_00037276 [Brassica cretica]